MKRRNLVRLLGLGLVGLAGCGSSDSEDVPTPYGGEDATPEPGIPPGASVKVYPFDTGSGSEFEFEESADGEVIIRVPVENTKDEAYAGKITMRISANDTERDITRTFQLGPNESKKVPIEVRTDWDSWTRNFGGIRFSEGTPVDS